MALKCPFVCSVKLHLRDERTDKKRHVSLSVRPSVS